MHTSALVTKIIKKIKMEIPAIFNHTKRLPGNILPLNFHSVNSSAPVIDHRKFRPTSDGPSDYAFALMNKLKNPVDIIYLSVSMLRTSVHDSDSQVYLDVIRRNALQVDILIRTFLNCEQIRGERDN